MKPMPLSTKNKLHVRTDLDTDNIVFILIPCFNLVRAQNLKRNTDSHAKNSNHMARMS